MNIEDLIEINRRLSHDLWNVSCFNNKPSGLSPRLIFPEKRINNEIRISEQEARKIKGSDTVLKVNPNSP